MLARSHSLSELASSHRPSELARSDRPSELTRSDRPSELTRSDRPSELTRSDRPSELTRSDRPSELTRSDRPSEWARSDRPSEWASHLDSRLPQCPFFHPSSYGDSLMLAHAASGKEGIRRKGWSLAVWYKPYHWANHCPSSLHDWWDLKSLPSKLQSEALSTLPNRSVLYRVISPWCTVQLSYLGALNSSLTLVFCMVILPWWTVKVV